MVSFIHVPSLRAAAMYLREMHLHGRTKWVFNSDTSWDCLRNQDQEDTIHAIPTGDDEWACHDKDHGKWGWVNDGSRAGSSMHFEADFAHARSVVFHPVVLHLTYLKSYENMGTFTVTVQCGDAKATTTILDGLWDDKVSVDHSDEIGRAGPKDVCKISVKTNPNTDGRTGSKVKIRAVSAFSEE